MPHQNFFNGLLVEQQVPAVRVAGDVVRVHAVDERVQRVVVAPLARQVQDLAHGVLAAARGGDQPRHGVGRAGRRLAAPALRLQDDVRVGAAEPERVDRDQPAVPGGVLVYYLRIQK